MNYQENPIAQNRAEEIGYDFWEEFVIPPFYDILDLLSAKKPRVVVGGRGCGKTSLLRFLCHQTQFSEKRSNIDISDLTHIGLYWKIDTQFAKQLSNRGLNEDEWRIAFEHMATLLICKEILKSLESIAESSFIGLSREMIDTLDLSILSSFNDDVPNNFAGLKLFIRRESNYFQAWVGGIKNKSEPSFLPKQFINELLTEVKSQIDVFEDANFYVYIDEYENLLLDQQRLINTWLKHSEVPLIFNLAMKRNSFLDKNTIGAEQLSEIHDYREYDLESYYKGQISFDLFAAEILFLRLWKGDNNIKIPITISELRSTDKNILEKRRSIEYRKKVLNAANDYLPSVDIVQACRDVFKDKILKRRFEILLDEALKTKSESFSLEKLPIDEYPHAVVILPSLIARNIPLKDVLIQIENLESGNDNKFTGKTDWIHNNVNGCLLMIYEPLGRDCPLYAGFDSFCLMSKTNLRHFLELCFKSITNEKLSNSKNEIKSISIKAQSEAAKQASTSFLKEVKSFGNNGNSLHTFVLRLGTYFKFAHKRLAQSEPEQNHFSINGTQSLEITKFLNDAIKWSVIYENKITKQKGGKNKLESEDFEYILNPIYAPYFHISFRKKRRIDFNVHDFNSILFGDFNEFENYLRNTLKRWKMVSDDSELNLFSEVN
jgi:hypothetical protein